MTKKEQMLSGGNLGTAPSEFMYYEPSAGPNRRARKNASCNSCSATRYGLAHDSRMMPAISQPESGSYLPFDVLSTGASGARDYDRAMRESEMARTNPTMLAMTTNTELDVPFHEPIVPKKPKPVELAGMSVFGTGGPSSTSRGMTTDFRGEAVDQYAVGAPPEGASISGRMGTVPNVKESLNARGLPKELQRCYANPACKSKGHAETSSLLKNLFMGFTAV